MSSKVIRHRQLTSVNNENPVRKNIKNTMVTNRKKSALKVLTNTVQSTKKKSPNKSLKNLKALTMEKFEMDLKCLSPPADIYNRNNDEFNHINCATLLENDSLPSSMTCNIGMLSDFFSFKSSNDSDWFLEDYNKTMVNKIKNTFENFGEPVMEEYSLAPMPEMDFSEILSF